MPIQLGDLVQFKLEQSNRKRVWEGLPSIHLGNTLTWGCQNAEYIFGPPKTVFRYNDASVAWEDTKKIGMVVTSFAEVCFTASRLPALRKAATKRFARLMLFSGDPLQGPRMMWALEEDLEQFDDKSYLEGLKKRLREAIAQKAP